MMISLRDPSRMLIPNEDDSLQARRLLHQLSSGEPINETAIELRLTSEQGVTSIPVPVSVFSHLRKVLSRMAERLPLSMIPLHYELTVFQAADLLNVSSPYLDQLLDRGELPFHQTDTIRRIFFADVIEYERNRYAARMKVLDELTREAQKLGLGY
jgi:excisionase family DNA binding protein